MSAANELKKEEETELRSIFTSVAKAQDSIDATQLISILRTQNVTLTEADATALVAKWGSGGKLNIDQFLALRKDQVSTRTDEQELRDAFSVFDKTHQGLVDKEVLRNALLKSEVKEQEVNDLLSLTDKFLDDKGAIKVNELTKYLLGQ